MHYFGPWNDPGGVPRIEGREALLPQAARHVGGSYDRRDFQGRAVAHGVVAHGLDGELVGEVVDADPEMALSCPKAGSLPRLPPAVGNRDHSGKITSVRLISTSMVVPFDFSPAIAVPYNVKARVGVGFQAVCVQVELEFSLTDESPGVAALGRLGSGDAVIEDRSYWLGSRQRERFD